MLSVITVYYVDVSKNPEPVKIITTGSVKPRHSTDPLEDNTHATRIQNS
jgi:hypothetical protein